MESLKIFIDLLPCQNVPQFSSPIISPSSVAVGAGRSGRPRRHLHSRRTKAIVPTPKPHPPSPAIHPLFASQPTVLVDVSIREDRGAVAGMVLISGGFIVAHNDEPLSDVGTDVFYGEMSVIYTALDWVRSNFPDIDDLVILNDNEGACRFLNGNHLCAKESYNEVYINFHQTLGTTTLQSVPRNEVHLAHLLARNEKDVCITIVMSKKHFQVSANIFEPIYKLKKTIEEAEVVPAKLQNLSYRGPDRRYRAFQLDGRRCLADYGIVKPCSLRLSI